MLSINGMSNAFKKRLRQVGLGCTPAGGEAALVPQDRDTRHSGRGPVLCGCSRAAQPRSSQALLFSRLAQVVKAVPVGSAGGWWSWVVGGRKGVLCSVSFAGTTGQSSQGLRGSQTASEAFAE